MRYFLTVALVVFLTGCMSNPRIEDITSEQRAKLRTITIFDGTPDRNYDVLGAVTGLSCNRNKFQAADVSDSEAMEGIKLNAAKLGADAVINTVCQKTSDTDWRNNCWASVKCIGDAIRFK